MIAKSSEELAEITVKGMYIEIKFGSPRGPSIYYVSIILEFLETPL